MTLNFTSALLLTRIKHTKLLIAASRSDKRTVPVPRTALDDISVTTNREELITLLNIPQLDCEIAGGSGKHIVCTRMEVHSTNLSLVTTKNLNGFSDACSKTFFRNLSNANVAILRARSNELLIERREVKVEHSRLVNRNKRDITKLASLIVTENSIDTTTSSLPKHSEILGVGSKEIRIPAGSSKFSVSITLLGLGNLCKNVTEL